MLHEEVSKLKRRVEIRAKSKMTFANKPFAFYKDGVESGTLLKIEHRSAELENLISYEAVAFSFRYELERPSWQDVASFPVLRCRSDEQIVRRAPVRAHLIACSI